MKCGTFTPEIYSECQMNHNYTVYTVLQTKVWVREKWVHCMIVLIARAKAEQWFSFAGLASQKGGYEEASRMLAIFCS